tara:strand:+ start:2193 stop:3065 length:873 start_codon:yes stop_codon:yes gene_type:complete
LYEILFNDNDSFNFILYDCDKFAEDKLRSKNIDFIIEDSLESQIKKAYKENSKNIIINDVLNTSKEDIRMQKSNGFKVVNIEDLGEGAQYADVVINALYSKIEGLDNQFVGPKYTILREEFIKNKDLVDYKKNDTVLVSFGGVDPKNISESIFNEISKTNLPFKIIQPPFRSLNIDNKNILRPPIEMAKTISKAKLVVSSMGRTVFESASLGIPIVSIAQNKRETEHIKQYLNYINYLGEFKDLNFSDVVNKLVSIYNDTETLNTQREKLLNLVDFKGSQRIKKIIESIP